MAGSDSISVRFREVSALERSMRALENVSLKESNKRLKNGGHQIQVYISGRSISVSNSVKKND